MYISFLYYNDMSVFKFLLSFRKSYIHVLVLVVAAQKTTIRAIVIDPEVVFVANLMKADAPALVASFQCDFSLLSEEAAQVTRVNLKGLKILACPFIRNKDSKAITTVNVLFCYLNVY